MKAKCFFVSCCFVRICNYKKGNTKWGRGNRKNMSSEKLRYALGITV